jgi:hypothetical protein
VRAYGDLAYASGPERRDAPIATGACIAPGACERASRRAHGLALEMRGK